MPTGRGGHDRRWIRTLGDERGAGSALSGSIASIAAALTAAEDELAAQEVIDAQGAVLIAASTVTDAAAAAALSVAVAGAADATAVRTAAARTADARSAPGGDEHSGPDPATARALAATLASAAVAEAALTAHAVGETQAAVLAAAHTVAEAAAAAALTVAAVVEAHNADARSAPPDGRWLPVMAQHSESGEASVEAIAATVAAAALAEEGRAAQAVAETQAAVLTAAYTVAKAAAAAAETIAAAVAAKATVVAAAAAAAAQARTTEDQLRHDEVAWPSHRPHLVGRLTSALPRRNRRRTTTTTEQGAGRGPAAQALAATVASAALGEAELAAAAVVETQAAVLSAARTVAMAAATAAQTVAAAVAANAAVVAAAAAAAARARDTEYRLRHDVLHDELTGLGNRRGLLDHLTHALARSGRDGTTVTVLFLDVDGFKRVNDVCGHSVGDQLLIHVAGQLQRLLRQSDTCARVGGDEFVVVIEDTDTSQDEGRLVADRITAVLAAGVTVLEPHTMRVGVSIGVAVSTATSLPRDLLEQADNAMYRAKAQTKLEQNRLRPTAATPEPCSQ